MDFDAEPLMSGTCDSRALPVVVSSWVMLLCHCPTIARVQHTKDSLSPSSPKLPMLRRI